MSQNSMPRKVVSGLPARMKPMSADHPEAMTTPVRSSRAAARDAEDVRIGERVAQQHLHEGTRQREQPADGEGAQCARQAQRQNDIALQRIAAALQYGPDAGFIDVDAADHQRK